MKIRFSKNYLTYKEGQEIELGDVEAKELVDAGKAVEVKADPVEESVKAFEAKISEVAQAAAETAATKAVEKVGKALASKRAQIVVGPDRITEDPTGGFKSLGEFAGAVRKMAMNQGMDERLKPLMSKAAHGNTEGAAPDAGPTVPVEYSAAVINAVIAESALLDYAYKVTVSLGKTIEIPVLKNYDLSNTTAANGVVAAWISEGGTNNASKTNWAQLELKLNKIGALIPVTDELLADNIVALNSVIARESAFQIGKGIQKAILRGTGTTQPVGIIGHASAIDVAAEDLQAAATINIHNVSKMYGSFYGDPANAVWIVGYDAVPQLMTMTNGNYPVYLPANSISGKPFDTLFGIPVVKSGFASALGTSGDIVLADMSKYVVAMKGGLEQAVSMHLYFDTHETAFRSVLRIDGKPALTGPVTLGNGLHVSPFVTLASRLDEYSA